MREALDRTGGVRTGDRSFAAAALHRRPSAGLSSAAVALRAPLTRRRRRETYWGTLQRPRCLFQQYVRVRSVDHIVSFQVRSEKTASAFRRRWTAAAGSSHRSAMPRGRETRQDHPGGDCAPSGSRSVPGGRQ